MMSNFKLDWVYILNTDYVYNIKTYLPADFDKGHGCARANALKLTGRTQLVGGSYRLRPP